MNESMENVYRPPEADLRPAADSMPRYRLFRVSSIVVATFFGDLLAGAILIGVNFKRTGHYSAYQKAVVYGLIAQVVAALVYELAVSRQVSDFFDQTVAGALTFDQTLVDVLMPIGYGVGTLVAMGVLCHRYQHDILFSHRKNDGAYLSHWLAAGIGVLVSLLTAFVTIGVLYLTGNDEGLVQGLIELFR